MKQIMTIAAGLILTMACILGCQNSTAPNEDVDNPFVEFSQLERTELRAVSEASPVPLVTVNVGSDMLEFWPYTGTNFSGIPQDPINLIFYGKADPRDIRAALLALDGNRIIPGLPPVPPVNCTWTDAVGDIQTGYESSDQWTGSVIQLECGPYAPLRFHIRLFPMGQWTVASVHFEVLIPGTSDHQVLSWELAEQFVIADFMRTGLLDPDMPLIPTAQINDTPFRVIPAIIYNELPMELRALAGGPLGNVTDDVPIATDGHAVILNLAESADRVAGSTQQDFEINFGIAIPRPFCASGPDDYVWVEGPVRLAQQAHLSEAGVYKMHFEAQGVLSVVPLDPSTGEPAGPPLPAFVVQRHDTQMNDNHYTAYGVMYQRIGEGEEDGGGLLFSRLRVKTDGQNGFDAGIRCNSDTAPNPAAAKGIPAGLLSGNPLNANIL